MKKKKVKFSVGLGLFDYINPLCYLVTAIMIICNMDSIMYSPWNIIFIIGCVISIIFGFTIPTVKLLVGLGKFEFKMPVNLVFYVNSGILISGLCLFKGMIGINNYLLICLFLLILLLLYLIYYKFKKFNTVAVLTGAIGYMFIYASLIVTSISKAMVVPIVLYCIAILCYFALIGIGIKANLKDARVHWVIESCNVLCQLCVAIATTLLFI